MMFPRERPFDVAKSKEIADLLAEWDVAVTDKLMEERHHGEEARGASDQPCRARTARHDATTEGVAAQPGRRRGEERREASRNCRGSRRPWLDLLALAAQYDNADVATMLLTHWKIFQDDSHPLIRHDEKAKQGWTPIAIAVFHQSKRTARVLLEHGANPRLKNQYNKNAMDLAQDELDAALNVVTSRQEIRKVLEEWESHQLASTLENSRNKIAVGAAEPLPADGGVTLLAIEVASEAQANATKGKAKKKKAPRK
ncbi:hypothetical protein Ae201684P_004000 [Aphanomyces euteiches]|nr:hypothetical protein Ae201684P_004000 [Aphanomyces euteiches]